MDKLIFNALIETGTYNDFTIAQVMERSKNLVPFVETKDSSQILWGLINFEEFGDVTVNNLKLVAYNILSFVTAVPAVPVDNTLDVPPQSTEVISTGNGEELPPTDAPPLGEFNGVQQNIG